MRKTCSKFLRVILPVRVYAAFRSCLMVVVNKWQFNLIHFKINRTIARLKAQRSCVRVGFYVASNTAFQMETVFQLLCADPQFDVTIVVIPCILFGRERMLAQLTETYESLTEKYPRKVRNSLDGGEFLDFVDDFDLLVTMNPYDGYTMRQYTIPHLAKSGKPVVFARYYYPQGGVWDDHFISMPSLGYCWRFYLESQALFAPVAKAQPILKKYGRLVASGVPKIDRLAGVRARNRDRKCIIIAPHHTVVPVGDFQIGNFPAFSDLYLSLPVKYPDIDWIFRPHPQLIPRMIDNGFWTEAQSKEWLNSFASNGNAKYVPDGDYYDMFVNSDGMIEDCGSFLSEYFYVGHPQCYVLKSVEHEQRQFPSDFGKSLLANVYKAYSEKDIIGFVDNVIMGGNDPMKEEREKFAKEKLMFNYPHASEAIVADIKKALGRA